MLGLGKKAFRHLRSPGLYYLGSLLLFGSLLGLLFQVKGRLLAHCPIFQTQSLRCDIPIRISFLLIMHEISSKLLALSRSVLRSVVSGSNQSHGTSSCKNIVLPYCYWF